MPITARWNVFHNSLKVKAKTGIQVEELRAGDIGCTVKLKGSHTNQTLNPKGSDLKIERVSRSPRRASGWP
jgi:translation elongation factor EF-G